MARQRGAGELLLRRQFRQARHGPSARRSRNEGGGPDGLRDRGHRSERPRAGRPQETSLVRQEPAWLWVLHPCLETEDEQVMLVPATGSRPRIEIGVLQHLRDEPDGHLAIASGDRAQANPSLLGGSRRQSARASQRRRPPTRAPSATSKRSRSTRASPTRPSSTCTSASARRRASA